MVVGVLSFFQSIVMLMKIILCLIVLVFAAASAGAVTLLNGSFEEPHIDGSGDTVYTDGETIGAWTVIASQPTGVLLCYDDGVPPVWRLPMADGSQMVHIGESTKLNTLTQTITGFAPGVLYELSIASFEYGDAYNNELTLQVYNGATASYDLNLTYTGSPVKGIDSSMGYSTHQFTASGATLDLIITNESGSALTIDDVSIIPSVPIGIVTVTLDDPCGLSVGEEGPGSDDYTIVLGREPTDDVTIELEDTSEPDQVLIVPGALVFTAGNWDTAQTVTVSGIDDTILEYDPHDTVISHTVVSGDAGCHDLAVDNVDVEIAENDCGAWGYLQTDLNNDCIVNLGDFSMIAVLGELVTIAEDWLECTLPNIDGLECTKVTTCIPPGPLKAFPGAEGYGSETVGGRGGRVIQVTNLNDSGPGSLRAACEASGPRTVVFRVGGVIELSSYIVIRDPYITIAGQTAPGDGICIKDHWLEIEDTHDVIVRYIRTRPDAPINGDAFPIAKANNIIIDHCSVSWGDDEVLSAVTKDTGNVAKDITIQWCIISEGLDNANHSMGSGFDSKDGGMSLHHNIYAHNATRNPRVGSWPGYYINFDYRNNVMYNWESNCGYSGDGGTCPIPTCEGDMYVNYVGNYLKYGPSTISSHRYYAFKGDTTYCRLYHGNNSNYIYGSPSATADNDLAMDGNMKTSPTFAVPSWAAITTEDAQTAYNRVISSTGAGDTAHPRDAVDTRIINDIINGTGSIIDYPSDVGGWPTYNGGTPYPDSDQDGMDDDWELDHGLDPSDPDDHSEDRNSDGYTNLEEFLHCLVM